MPKEVQTILDANNSIDQNKPSVNSYSMQESAENSTSKENMQYYRDVRDDDITQKLRDTAHRVNDVGRPVGNALENDISNNSISISSENVNNESDDVQYSVGLTDAEDFDTKAFAGELINKFSESLNHRTVP